LIHYTPVSIFFCSASRALLVHSIVAPNDDSGNCLRALASHRSHVQVPVDNQVAWDVIIAIVFCIVFAFIGFMSIREFIDMRRGIVPKIVFD
jgi:hypothetical protein